MTDKICDFSELQKKQCDIIVVGTDQIWRPAMFLGRLGVATKYQGKDLSFSKTRFFTFLCQLILEKDTFIVTGVPLLSINLNISSPMKESIHIMDKSLGVIMILTSFFDCSPTYFT